MARRGMGWPKRGKSYSDHGGLGRWGPRQEETRPAYERQGVALGMRGMERIVSRGLGPGSWGCEVGFLSPRRLLSFGDEVLPVPDGCRPQLGRNPGLLVASVASFAQACRSPVGHQQAIQAPPCPGI